MPWIAPAITDMLDIEPFPAFLLVTQLPGYNTLYHHYQGEVQRKNYKSLVMIFSQDEQINA